MAIRITDGSSVENLANVVNEHDNRIEALEEGGGSGDGLALGETATTAYRGDRGKTAYDHSQVTGNPHGTTKADLELSNVDNTSDEDKPISSSTQIALDSKLPTATYTENKIATDAAIGELTPSGIKDIPGNYTYVLGDNKSKGIRSTDTAATTHTIPSNTNAAFAIGDTISIIQYGLGAITFVPASGVTLLQRESKFTTAGRYAVATLQKQDVNTWLLIGDLLL